MDREALRTEIATHMIGLVGQIDTFVTTYSGANSFAHLKQQMYGHADMYATLLEEPAQQEVAAQTLVAAMFGEKEPPEDFWRTETGRAVALAIGYPRDLVPRPMVQVILGLSRQRVHELITHEGWPESVDEQGKRYVHAGKVRAALRARVAGA